MKIIIINFGTSRHIADAFGPAVGSLLEDVVFDDDLDVKIFGTMHDNFNTLEQFNELQKYFSENEIDAVICTDAAKSSIEKFGEIFVSNTGIHPGLGCSVGKKTHFVGDYGYLLAVGPDPLDTHPSIKYTVDKAEEATEHIVETIKKMKEINFKGKYSRIEK